MPIVTLRPNANGSSASNYAVTGAASAFTALADDTDSSFIRKTVSGTASMIVVFPGTTVSTAQIVRRVRIRARAATPTSQGKLNVQVGTRSNGVNYFSSALAIRGSNSTSVFTGAWFSTAPDGGLWTQAKINQLRAQITDYRDSTDRAFLYEIYIDVDIAAQSTVTVSAPTGTITATAKPDVSWSVTDSDGDIASYYQVKVIPASVYSAAGFDPTTASSTWDSSQILGTDVSTTVGAFLSNGTYRAYVRTAKTINGAPFWSGWAFSQFTISLSPPTTPTLATSYDSTLNRVTLTATGATPTGFSSQTFEIQRTADAGVTWSPVRYAAQLSPSGSFVASVFDHEAPRGVTVGYRVRAVGLNGSNVQASAWSATANVSTVNSGDWIFKTVEPAAQVAAGVIVTGPDSWSTPEQIGTFRPLGREFPVVVSSAIQSDEGSYQITAIGQTAITAIENLLAYQGMLLVQTPFGDQKYIRVVSRGRTRTGTATNPRFEYEVGYVEISG